MRRRLWRTSATNRRAITSPGLWWMWRPTPVTLEVDDLGLDFGGLPEGLGQRCDALKTTGSIRIQINAINDKPHVAVPGSVYRPRRHGPRFFKA